MEMNKFKYAAIFALFSSTMSSFAATDTSTPEITVIDNVGVTAGDALNFGTLYNDTDLSGIGADNTIKIGFDGSVALGTGITDTTEHLSIGNQEGTFSITGPGTLSVELSHAGGHASVNSIDQFICNGVTGLSNSGCGAGDGAEATATGTVSYGATLELAETAETPISGNSIDLGTITITVVSA